MDYSYAVGWYNQSGQSTISASDVDQAWNKWIWDIKATIDDDVCTYKTDGAKDGDYYYRTKNPQDRDPSIYDQHLYKRGSFNPPSQQVSNQ